MTQDTLLVCSTVKETTRVSNIVEKCKKLIRKFGEVKASHIFREQNKVADILANNALDYDRGSHIFDLSLDWILPRLTNDMMCILRTQRIF